MKIVINRCFGGYGLSKEAVEYMAARGNEEAKACLEANRTNASAFGFNSYSMDEDRTSPILIEAVEALGDRASGYLAQLEIIEIPDDVDYYIHEYDGMESVNEKHRSW